MEIRLIENQEDLKHAFALRKEIFVQEQGVPAEDEFDQFDQLNGEAKHILLVLEEMPIGTGRLRLTGEYGKLERICILKDYRIHGFGKELIKALEVLAHKQSKSKIRLHGQAQAVEFYKKLGYQVSSGLFMEDGIAHYVMEKELP